jgi:hypothetical protein
MTYDDDACRAFAAGLGDAVLARAETLFGLLAAHGDVESPELALALGLARPQLIAGAVNTRLKVRAGELGLPLPFLGGCSHTAVGRPRRTVWRDRGDGTSARLLAALAAERQRRFSAQNDACGFSLYRSTSA